MSDIEDKKNKTTITEALEQLAVSDRYPFHMPGHKRRMRGIGNPYEYDITEIAGFDDLAAPGGIIADLLEELRELYDAGSVFLSLNGSTGSNLIGIFAATKQKDEVLIASNCHRSVFHAAELRELKVHRIDPMQITVERQPSGEIKITESIRKEGESIYAANPEAVGDSRDPIDDTILVANPKKAKTWRCTINGAISPDEIKRSLIEHPTIQLVVITSPTYEGIVSDIRGIADIVHAHGAKLFVDGAHGAHFTIANQYLQNSKNTGISGLEPKSEERTKAQKEKNEPPYFPNDALHLGADAVSVSLHKTLPMPGMSSLLLLPNEGEIEAERIAHYWQIFQSSSPSYLLMAMVDHGVRWLKENGTREFLRYRLRLKRFYEAAGDFEHLIVFQSEHKDPGKIVILQPDGHQLTDILLSDYSIDIERAEESHIIVMTSIMDDEEGFSRLLAALKEIDRKIVHRFQGEGMTGRKA